MQTTQLAHGKITNADALTIELIEPPGMPAAMLFRVPRQRRCFCRPAPSIAPTPTAGSSTSI
jgi:hypothetical protein